ncbi:MAG: hypothetical protein Q8O15_07015, partial [Rectinemataceae bacterium]|nr:hypothetical protein [Rectinemataceae bacterium]
YLGIFRTFAVPGNGISLAMTAAPVLAMIGALATACFVKVYGAVFLGLPRTGASLRAHEAPASMVIPMAVLAFFCLAIGLAPGLVVPVLEKTIAAWMHAESSSPQAAGLASLVPFASLGGMTLGLVGIVALVALFMVTRYSIRKNVGTWDCGYAKPEPRMQYTASSFAQSLVGLFGWILKPHTHRPIVEGAFPLPGTLASHVDELVLDRTLSPAFLAIRSRFSWFHRFQQGQTNNYIFYILATLFAMLATLLPLKALLAGLFSR